MPQSTVFISYSHKDEAEKNKLLTHLGVLQHTGLIDLWSDDRIKAGEDWSLEINQTIEQAKVAILLVTANFLTSNFILNQAVPQLLKRRHTEGLVVFPIIARACAWDAVEWLSQMKVKPNNGAPVWGDGGSHIDEDLAEIAREVAEIIKTAQAQKTFFISYKHGCRSDRQLADYLQEFLVAQGHRVITGPTAQSADVPLDRIDAQIKASDFLILLLSEQAVDSEMVQAETRRAYEYQKLQGYPQVLPVRLAYKGLLPYAIDTLLNPAQYIIWRNVTDTPKVAQDILAAADGHFPQQQPIQIKPAAAKTIIFEDGSLFTDEDSLHPPLPACDPRFLEQLQAPGGTVKLRDKFYIDREADAHLKRQIVQRGTLTTIRAARQRGKSSLLVRGIHHARQNQAKIVHLDLQQVDSNDLQHPDRFLRYLADFMVRKLRFDPAQVDKLWHGTMGPQYKLTYLLEDYVLPHSNTPIVLAIDEADSLLSTSFHNDFFGMLRSWHNSAAFDEQWEKFNLVLVISTEPYLLIAEAQQSPFNAGLKLYLEEFTEAQVRDLNWRHGSPVEDKDFPELMNMLGGHPYLTRKALYHLVTDRLNWAELAQTAATDDGLFADHLRHQQWMLRNEPDLKAALKQVIHHQQCPDETALFRLRRAGLVQKIESECVCRCKLYTAYFSSRL